MTVTDVRKDPQARTMAIVAAFDAPAERVWHVWADPRQLERWWGPPTYPATFVDHDLTPGATVTYFMTSPEGEQYHGWWKIMAVDAPRHLEFQDGFSDQDAKPNPDMPITVARVTLADRDGGGTTMTIESTFATVEDMEQTLAMGMEEGITLAVGQIDAILAEA